MSAATELALDDSGRNPTLWPAWTWRFLRQPARFDPAGYVLGERSPRRTPEVAS